ncbi:MAG: FG-GAP-like repeat-containing protein [Melioribacteraceae bacterium]|nr:FG-GAP-like repeat-containing protein [Melioribacteraceae bacterium]
MNYKVLITIIIFLLSSNLLTAQDSLYLYTVFHGENDQDQFGVVENVGDVNGDGFEDLVVGAPAYITGAESGGYAKLYFGGADFDTLADMTFRDYENKKGFGYTIAGNGDLNGDGYSDFAIANPYSGDFRTGKVYVYFGGSQLDTIPNLTLTLNPNEYFYTQFGFSMTMSGDINGDGYDDLVVSAPQDDWDRHGEVFIYFGGENMDTIPDVNLIYPKPLQEFGLYLDYISDINEDNIDDLLISSYPVDNDTTAFIFFGNKGNDIGFNNFYVFDEPLGAIVSILGDINGDGNTDFAVGNKVFLPPLTNNGFSKLTIHNEDNISFGIRSGIPDLNDDEYDDFICLSTKGREENILIVLGGVEVSINTAIVLKDPDDKTGFGRYVTSFSKLFSNNVVSLIIGDKETTDYTDHGTGKVFIYNNDLINTIGVGESSGTITDFNISQNYPNPFNPTTKIKFSIANVGDEDFRPLQTVKLIVYDILGREIATLVNECLQPGIYEVEFNAKGFTSGVYYYRIESGNFSDMKKMILLK